MRAESAKGYPLFFFSGSRARLMSILVALLISGLGIAFYLWYNYLGGDPSPDSIAGYTFAIVGTIFLILAVLGFTLYRRSRKRAVGSLNGALHWHMAFAAIGLVLLFLHSFGNFNLRTGTYALYGMIALVISGFVGRIFDHILPRLIAREAGKALTEQGEDRIESIAQQLQSVVAHNTQELRAFVAAPATSEDKQPAALALPVPFAGSGKPSEGSAALQTSWDLAYISLEEMPQELQTDPQYRFVPDRKSSLALPGAMIPGAQEHMTSLQRVERALEREQFYRYCICYWRIFHTLLALTTVGLTLWHIGYALQLLIPVWLHR